MPSRPSVLTPRQAVNNALGATAFSEGSPRALHVPLELHLQLVSGCNLDCYMCHEHLRPPGERHGRHLRLLDPALFERLAREVIPYTQRIELGVGGEPLLSPHFRTYLERCHGLRQSIHVTTNGTLLTTDALAGSLAQHASRIEISMDGATAKTYERIRKGGRFAPLLRNLENLQRHRLAVDPEGRPSLTLCMVLMRSNLAELPELVRLAASLGADGVAAWPVIPVTEEGRADKLDEDRDRLDGITEEARSLARELGVDLDAPAPRRPGPEALAGSPESIDPAEAPPEETPTQQEARSHRELAAARLDVRGIAPSATDIVGSGGQAPPPRSEPRCHMPFHSLYVLWNGDVFPCGNPLVHEHAPLGNLGSQSFDEVWNGRPLRNLRVGLGSEDVPSLCQRCPVVRRAGEPTTADDLPTGLVEHFGDQDLAPDPSTPADLLERCHRSGLGEAITQSRELIEETDRLREQVEDLSTDLEGHRAHSANLEENLANLEESLGHSELRCRDLDVSLGRHTHRSLLGLKRKYLRPLAQRARRALGRPEPGDSERSH